MLGKQGARPAVLPPSRPCSTRLPNEPPPSGSDRSTHGWIRDARRDRSRSPTWPGTSSPPASASGGPSSSSACSTQTAMCSGPRVAPTRPAASSTRKGAPIAGEVWWTGDCSARLDPRLAPHQPHYQVISRQDQAQIYQELVAAPPATGTANAAPRAKPRRPAHHELPLDLRQGEGQPPPAQGFLGARSAPGRSPRRSAPGPIWPRTWRLPQSATTPTIATAAATRSTTGSTSAASRAGLRQSGPRCTIRPSRLSSSRIVSAPPAVRIPSASISWPDT